MKHTVESYLAELESRMGLLEESQRAEILAEYRGHLSASLAEGASEREVMRKFEKPVRVAHQFYTTYGVYERYRKWQYAALALMVVYLVGLNEYLFGNPATLSSRLPGISTQVWSLSWLVLGPISYWIMTYRCRSQRVLPVLVAWLLITAGVGYTLTKQQRYMSNFPVAFASPPKSSAEAQALATASAPLEELSRLGKGMRSPENFGRKLLEIQPAVLSQSRFLVFREVQPKKYFIPVGRRTLFRSETGQSSTQSIEFGFTDSEVAAMSNWREFSTDVEGFASRIRPSVVEFSCGLREFTMWTMLGNSTMWLYLGIYMLYVAGVGILFTYLRIPSLARRGRRGTA